MNTGPLGDRQRKLVYIPIIHTAADMGTLAASVRGKKLSMMGRQGLARNAAAIEKMWDKIELAASRLALNPGTVRVYQDGLPICQHEQEIVSELAESGSRNHRLLLQLQSRGARVMGTESPELLVEEYQLAKASLGSGVTAEDASRQRQLRDTVLEKRDRFIADRINVTLSDGETGILFIGMLHSLSRFLDSDIRVAYPLGLPRVK
ncbi:MAG: hypothetical protein ABSG84_07095 [Acidobacteriaceae bacterium]|jgi:hypothetical protein